MGPASDMTNMSNTTDLKGLVPAGAQIENLAGGFGFLEGPVWTNREGGYLIFSDIPRHELKRWSERDEVTTFRAPSHNNGNTRDAQGTLLTAEHDGRRVSRTTADGTVEVVVERYEGKCFNSPNDLVVKTDGTIWFTDPHYGLPKGGEGRELDKNYVFRFDPKAGGLTALVDDFDMPNGLCFSPDEKRLYIADSGKPHHIRVFDVRDDGTIGGGRVFCTLDVGIPDGIRCDTEGRVWSSAGDGIHIFATDGSLIGKIVTPDAPGRFDPSKVGPEVPANLCFGGPDWSDLYITACTSL
ncbi:MAG TPA: SMP-30/gluconolactonase/LRE family protein, partial [Chloroflexota bacterium]|nr:SMP-30/gluconolactonase/LRE family protein [Chloroflexota bacterium]